MNTMRDMILDIRKEAKIKKQTEEKKLIKLYNSDDVVEKLFNHFEKKFKKLIEKSSEKLCAFDNLAAIVVVITKLKVSVNGKEITPNIKFNELGLQLLNNSNLNHLNEDLKDWSFEYFHEANYLPKKCWEKLVEKFQNTEYTVKVFLAGKTNYLTILLKL